MPRIKKFSIRNFKGIESVEFDFHNRIENKILTFIGLNESGKTTVLEALSHFVTSDKTTNQLFDGPYAQQHIASLIPIHKNAAFTGNVSISAVIELDKTDKEEFTKIFEANKLRLYEKSIPNEITVQRSYSFKDSKLLKSYNFWVGFKPIILQGKNEKHKDYIAPPTDSTEPNLWLECINTVENKLPNMAYFPTFLVDLPSKIYLTPHENEKPVNRYYRTVLQDVLDSLGEKLDLETHVVKRIDDFKERDSSPSWFPKFFEDPDKRSVDAVFHRLSAAITKEVLGNWQRVFNRPVSAKQIKVDWNIDPTANDLPYASFSVSDGESLYQINQRSLGFRWFFSFLLFTRFKSSGGRSTLFLFDEPAANLHARAQAQLLESFEKIAKDGNIVVYSTHSHHMIEPKWLTGAYIVENESVDYDSDDYATSFSSTPTNIKVTSYRDFVSQQPDRMSYFQPVLERLQYQEPAIVGSGPQVFLEGISDFNAFENILRQMKRPGGLRLVPGFGAGSLGPAISRALSEGRQFRILLDDDTAGRRAKEKYLTDWVLPDGTVLTLADFDKNLSGKKLEDLIQEETKEKVRLRFSGKSGKKQLNFYLAEILAISEKDGIDDKTTNAIKQIILKLNDGLV